MAGATPSAISGFFGGGGGGGGGGMRGSVGMGGMRGMGYMVTGTIDLLQNYFRS